ncbi:MAG: 3-keto-disaccharide hydrolase [Opitutales bacterium]
MKTILLSLVSLLCFNAAHAEWVSLFDGKTLNGWTSQAEAINWRVEDGAIVANSGPKGLLTTPQLFENYTLELDFKAAIGTNSGIFLNTEPVVKNEATQCYEVNIAPQTNGFPLGSLVKFHKIEGIEEKDTWRTYSITLNEGTITVVLDGEKLYEHTPSHVRPVSLIGLQKNRGPIAFRNIRMKEIQ